VRYKIINIKNLSKTSDLGRWVSYKSHGKVTNGRIKSWNDKFVFVVYHCDNDWDDYRNYTAAATRPEDLTFITEQKNENSKRDKQTNRRFSRR